MSENELFEGGNSIIHRPRPIASCSGDCVICYIGMCWVMYMGTTIRPDEYHLKLVKQDGKFVLDTDYLFAIQNQCTLINQERISRIDYVERQAFILLDCYNATKKQPEHRDISIVIGTLDDDNKECVLYSVFLTYQGDWMATKTRIVCPAIDTVPNREWVPILASFTRIAANVHQPSRSFKVKNIGTSLG